MTSRYPEWAASSWDNTGLLIDSTREDPVESGGVVLLTNDVTDAVVTEALEMKASIIISYREALSTHSLPCQGTAT